MTDAIQFGPFLIKYSLLIIVIALFLGFVTMNFLLKKLPHYRKFPIIDLFFNCLFIVFFTWKFGPVIFHPMFFLENPVNFMYISGTIKHIWLGALLALIYVYVKSKKSGIPISMISDIFSFGFLVYSLIYNLFIWEYGFATSSFLGFSISQPEYKYHPINIYKAILSLVLLLWLLKEKKKLGEGKIFSVFFIIFGSVNLLFTFLEPQTIWFLGISLQQFVYLSLITIGMVTFPNHPYQAVK